MLTLLAVLASSVALSACGGKSGSSSTSNPAGTTTTKHGHKSKPTY
jgi:ABC-type glycerol-3-phosphate transport system substrate-binding protein